MKAKETRLDTLMTMANQQFIAPIFQRKYSWKEKQCEKLWEDVIRIWRNENPEAWHFIWSLVCYQQATALPWKVTDFMIIDWQQRLTTMSLIMLAIAREYQRIWDQLAYKTTMENYIINNNFTWDDRYKLVPTYEDRETYFAIVEWREDKLQNPSKQLLSNFKLFCEHLNWNEELLQNAYIWVNKLDLVYVILTQNQDNPQLIFESMNSTGLWLSQWDLLRNYLLLDMNQADQERLYEDYRKPMEQRFWQEWYANYFDSFLRNYLAMYKKAWINIWKEYEGYKSYFSDKGFSKEDMLKDLEKYSTFFVRICLCKDPDSDLNALWKELKVQRVDVSLPFILNVYKDYDNNELSKEDFITIIKALNSYVYRRYIVWIPTNSLNKTFATLYNCVNKADYKDSILAAFVLFDSYKRFPTDEEFKEAFAKKDMYNTRLKNYTLEKLENDNHLNAVTIDWTDISIEHVFPETENLKPHWQVVLWENWKELQKENVHRIWNLTITKWVYNSKMSDLPFLDKINVEWWIKASHYRLSDDIVDKEKWDLSDINERSNRLAEQSLNIWSYPTISDEKLEEYRNTKTSDNQKTIYTNIDHLQQMDPAIYAIYEKYEEFILSLDWVEKDIKKLYISYKYEWSNIVEIKPRMKNFHLMIDIPYEEIEDPADFIDNVEWVWVRGTGTSRVIVDSLDNFEYVKWLIRKSLEYAKENELE